MTTIEERRLNFLNEKLGYFIEDPSRRAYNQETGCMYWDKSTGNKCLIGREIPEEKYNEQYEGNVVRSNEIFNLLPESIQGLGITFLCRCQGLHDEEAYWTDTGLSERGLTKLADIKEIFCGVN
jgi:hypothetical protein